ncbi:MAG: TRAP transporter small permease [Casimicrobiaceae bacterium]|nr:TRAP transporter small permease [Casimicrobiaceae bacterium]MDW8311647.1 TRAP transporter small permease [Burkholderiales bacterium]
MFNVLTHALERYCRFVGALCVAALALMVVLVFGNVFLRYAFNSGITTSEEVSRWLFVWMSFLGAVIALHEGAHLGTDLLIRRFPPRLTRVVQAVVLLAMLGIVLLLAWGSWQQTRINWTSTSAVTQAPIALLYGAGVVFALSAIPILVRDLLRLAHPGTEAERVRS